MRRRAAVAAAIAIPAGAPAAAHGVLPGAAGFIPGVLHPLVTVEHLILLLALGLLCGQVPAERRRAAFAALGLALVVGLAAAAWRGAVEPAVPVAILALACAAGGLVALARPGLPAAGIAALAALAGLTVGLDTDVIGAGQAGGQVLLAPGAGVAVGAYLVVLDAAALAAAAARPPFAVAVRVAGSWIAAIGVLLLALSFSRLEATA